MAWRVSTGWIRWSETFNTWNAPHLTCVHAWHINIRPFHDLSQFVVGTFLETLSIPTTTKITLVTNPTFHLKGWNSSEPFRHLWTGHALGQVLLSLDGQGPVEAPARPMWSTYCLLSSSRRSLYLLRYLLSFQSAFNSPWQLLVRVLMLLMHFSALAVISLPPQ